MFNSDTRTSPDEDFPETLRNHLTEPTLDRDNNPDNPGDDGPGDDPWEGQVDSNDENTGNNLATAISALARNVRTQGTAPSISCFPIRTLDSEYNPELNTTPTTSC